MGHRTRSVSSGTPAGGTPPMTDESLHVAVVDIGSLTNLGWVIEGPSVQGSGTNIDSLIEALAGASNNGPLALGFEAPMFAR